MIHVAAETTRIQCGSILLPDCRRPHFHGKHFGTGQRMTERRQRSNLRLNLVCFSLSASVAVPSSTLPLVLPSYSNLDELKSPPPIQKLFERKIGNNGENQQQLQQRKPRFLCLHGFRTNGEILKKQVQKWPKSVLIKMDLMFVDAPFPAEGKSDVEGIFDPPYYEWFQYNQDQSEFKNFDKGLVHIENFMLKHGPFDGLLGFSQGAFISGALPGLQEKSLALTKVPKIKFLIIIGGGKCLPPSLADNAYSSPIEVPSLHLLGDRDYMKPQGMKLMELFVDPLVIHHRRGHTVPRLGKPVFILQDMEIMINFLERTQCSLIPSREEPTSVDEDKPRESYVKTDKAINLP